MGKSLHIFKALIVSMSSIGNAIKTSKESNLITILKKDNLKIEFNLVDYRNNYFISNDLAKILDFYNSFENRKQLIEWMQARPKGSNIIYEVEGDKDIIVVIPTADYNGKFAKECRDHIFNGLHIIFVGSGPYKDNYFNFSHTCNVGIRKAMEYNPKWIVVSGDDVYKIDDLSKLTLCLNELNPLEYDLIYAKPGIHHSKLTYFIDMHSNRIAKILQALAPTMFTSWISIPKEIPQKFKNFSFFAFSPIWTEKKGIKPLSRVKFFGVKVLRIKVFKIINLASFGVLSSNFIKKIGGNIYEEAFINGFEDFVLSFKIYNSRRFKITDFSMGSYVGSTMGGPNNIPLERCRNLRDIANFNLFDEYFLPWR